MNFINDAAGQALRRDEDLNSTTTDVAPHEVWYRFAGREMAVSGNNGTAQTAWEPSAKSRATTSGTGGVFRYGQTAHSSYTEADPSLERINSYNQGSVAGSYTVRGGETLSSIAAQLWGDAGLWYKIAEANGMTAATALAEGQQLRLPAGVMRSTHNAATFKPFDASEVIGDTSPTTPKPQKNNRCGMLGQVLIAAVSIAVTAILPHVSAFFGTVGGGIIGGMISSAAGQGFGIAIGAQEKFDWKAVAMAGVTAGITGGLNKAGGFAAMGVKGSSFGIQAAQGAIANGLAQGVGVVTGLQSKFDFAGVAAAALGQGVTGQIGGKGFGSHMLRIGADELVSAASRSALTGTSFGDNLIAVLPSVIGRTIGGAIAEGLGRASRPERIDAEEARQESAFDSLAPKQQLRLLDTLEPLDPIVLPNGSIILQRVDPRAIDAVADSARSRNIGFGRDQLTNWSDGAWWVDTDPVGQHDSYGVNYHTQNSSDPLSSLWFDVDGQILRFVVNGARGVGQIYSGDRQELDAVGVTAIFGDQVARRTERTPWMPNLVDFNPPSPTTRFGSWNGDGIHWPDAPYHNPLSRLWERTLGYPIAPMYSSDATWTLNGELSSGEITGYYTPLTIAAMFYLRAGAARPASVPISGPAARPATSVISGRNLNTHLRYQSKYGAAGTRELQNGRFRYYGNFKPARTSGEMAGGRMVREWDPITGNTRGWYETLDHAGRVRSAAPKPPTGPQNHRVFDADGRYITRR